MVRWILVLPRLLLGIAGCGDCSGVSCTTEAGIFTVAVVDAQDRPVVGADITVTKQRTGERSDAFYSGLNPR